MMMTLMMTWLGYTAAATGDNTPVGSTEIAITQCVAYWVDGTVDVTQPVA